MKLLLVLGESLALPHWVFTKKMGVTKVAALVYITVFEFAFFDGVGLVGGAAAIEPVSQIPMAKRPRIVRHRKCIVSTVWLLLGVILRVGLILLRRGSYVLSGVG